jgi:release factor glutamine methyltransferase
MNQIQTIKSAQVAAISQLQTEEAAIEVQVLLQHILKVNRAWMIVHEDDAIEPCIYENFQALIKRRLSGEPIAYILSHRDFYDLKLKVTSDTLIPRPDTETLVEVALSVISQDQTLKILDLGTGSGAIALAIATNRPKSKVTATDKSKNALNVAIENANNLSIHNVNFKQSDWFKELINEKFDVIVSNPPYIKENDIHLTQGDLRYEPIMALSSGQDGLKDIKLIIEQSKKNLNPKGYLLLEHGYNQAESVGFLLNGAGFNNVETIKDLGGNDRVSFGKV